VNKINDINVNYLKIPIKHRESYKMPPGQKPACRLFETCVLKTLDTFCRGAFLLKESFKVL